MGWLKKALIGLGAVVGVGVLGIGGYACIQIRAFDESTSKVYEIPLPKIELSTDPAVLARGKHLAEAVASCTNADCHGADLAGGKLTEVGPLLTMQPPNITKGGLGATYTDAEIARLIRHGVKKDGRTARMMPSNEFNWISESDLVAIVSFVRSMPAVDKPNGPMVIKPLAKILDRRNAFPLDIARRIDHQNIELAPPPSPTRDYGRFLGKLCSGCHGEAFAGGPIPGAPPDLPVPLNLTPHETGLKGYTYEDFWKILDTGTRKDGRKLADFMPFASVRNMDETERKALWAYLSSLPPEPFSKGR
jgi:hypothetical protein